MTGHLSTVCKGDRPASSSGSCTPAPLALLIALAVLVGPAFADDAGGPEPQAGAGTLTSASQVTGLQEVVVTAQKRSENLQQVPIAISALSGDQLASMGVGSTEDLASASPGVLITEFGQAANAMAIYVRGIGQLDFAEHQESPVALYIDGAYVSFQGAASIGLYDLQQLSILRGPQGTLFGRNANGGVVQITTNQPTDNFTAYGQETVGSYGQFDTEGAISGPVTDNLDARFSFLYTRQSPWLDNTLGPSLGADNTANARLQLLYKFDAQTQDLFAGFVSRSFPVTAGTYVPSAAAPDPANHDLSENTSGPLFVAFCQTLGFTVSEGATNCQGYRRTTTDPFQISDPHVGNFDRIVAGVTNTFTHDMSWAKLTSITNYTSYGKHYLEDDSDDPIPIVGYKEDADAYQASQELQLNGQTTKLHWVAGLYLLDIHGHYDNETVYVNILDPILFTGSNYIQNVSSFALYDQIDYALTDQWGITLGERIERDDKRIDLTAFCSATPATCDSFFVPPASQFVQGSYADTEWSGNLQLTYKPSSDLMLYAGIRRGTKGAEITATTFPAPGLTFDSILVKPEILTDTEVGFKSEVFDHRLRLNGDVFYYHYEDYQAFKFVDFADILFNAPARDYGAELSASALLTPTLTADLGLAYLHTTVSDVELPDGTYADQQQPVAPKFSLTANLRKEWRVSFGRLFAETNWAFVGSRYYGSVNQPELYAGGYTLGNVSVGYETSDDKWNATLSVKNVTDKVIPVDKFDVVSSGGYSETSLAPPRWVSFQVRYKF
jgi:iron complex outermembrane recepter protein